MSDLISRQVAIEYFMTNTNWHDEDGYEIHDAEDKRALLKSYFDGIPPAQPEPRWIPVSERLPEEDTDVMIAYRYKAGEGDTSHCDIDITSYGQAYFGGRACGFKEWRAPFEYFHSNYEVVAWTPLPEPYKEEQDV